MADKKIRASQLMVRKPGEVVEMPKGQLSPEMLGVGKVDASGWVSAGRVNTGGMASGTGTMASGTMLPRMTGDARNYFEAYAQWVRQIEAEDPEYAEVVRMYTNNKNEKEARYFATAERDGVTAILTVTVRAEKNEAENFKGVVEAFEKLLKDLRGQTKTQLGKAGGGRFSDPLPFEQVRYYRHIWLLIRRAKKIAALPEAQHKDSIAQDKALSADGYLLAEFEDLCAEIERMSPKPLAIWYLKRKFSINSSDDALEKKLRAPGHGRKSQK